MHVNISSLGSKLRASNYPFSNQVIDLNNNVKMIGQGGWDVFVTGANGFVGKDSVVKGM